MPKTASASTLQERLQTPQSCIQGWSLSQPKSYTEDPLRAHRTTSASCHRWTANTLVSMRTPPGGWEGRVAEMPQTQHPKMKESDTSGDPAVPAASVTPFLFLCCSTLTPQEILCRKRRRSIRALTVAVQRFELQLKTSESAPQILRRRRTRSEGGAHLLRRVQHPIKVDEVRRSCLPACQREESRRRKSASDHGDAPAASMPRPSTAPWHQTQRHATRPACTRAAKCARQICATGYA